MPNKKRLERPFPFITLPTLVNFAGLGILLGSLIRRRAVSFSLFGLYIIATVIHSLYQVWWGQQVPSNLIIAFANASGYAGFSDKLSWNPAFIYFRLLVVLLGIGYVALAIIIREPGRSRPLRIASAVAVLAIVIAIGLSIHNPDKWGIGAGRTKIATRLTGVYETEHAIIHYPENTPVALHIAQIAEDHEWLFHQLCGTLNHTPAWKVNSYIYSDSSQMQDATGADGYIFTQPWHHEIHIPYEINAGGIDQPTLKHEMVHLIMGDFGDRFLRINMNRGILEGTAVAIADDLFRGPDFQGTAARAKQSGHLTPASVLFSQSGFGFGDASISKSYDLAGSFMGFLISRYGMEKLQTLYRNSDFDGTYGKSLRDLDGEWQQYLSGVYADEREIKRISYLYDDTVFRPMFKDSCPRIGNRQPSPYEQAETLLREKRYAEAITRYCEIYTSENQNPRWLVRIADVYREEEDYSNAIATMEVAAESQRLPHIVLEDAIKSLFDLLIREHNWADAERVLDEAEHRDAGTPEWREVRRRILHADPGVRELVFDGLNDPKNETASSDFRQAIISNPPFGIPYLLLAERVNRREGASETYFVLSDKFLQLTDGLESLKARVLLRLGEFRYAQKDWNAARDYFGKSSQLAQGGQQRRTADDWLERVDWREHWNGASMFKGSKSLKVLARSLRNNGYDDTF